MSTKKKAKKSPPLVALISSPVGLESAINRYVTAQLELTERRAALEKQIADLKTNFDTEAQPLSDEVLGLETGIQLYCITHRADLFSADRKSREYANATVGFRLTPFSVDKILSKDTWDAIADRLDELPWGEKYVVTKLSVNKEELLKDRANLTHEQLAVAGVKFCQGENFYIEPDSQVLDARRKPVDETSAAA